MDKISKGARREAARRNPALRPARQVVAPPYQPSLMSRLLLWEWLEREWAELRPMLEEIERLTAAPSPAAGPDGRA